MSRSFKKHPWIKCAGDTSFKKLFNRRLRRSSRTQDYPNGNAYKKYNNSYNIADYRCNCSWEEFQKWDWVVKRFDTEKAAKDYWKRYYRGK